MDFGSELRRLLIARGMSQREAARLAPCDPGYLSKVANGFKRPSTELAARLDEVLGADGALAALAAPLLDGLEMAAGDRVAWAARHPRQAGTAVAGPLADVLAAQRRTEDALGSAAMIRPVSAQLAVVEDLAREAIGPGRLDVIDVAQQWAQFAGWLYLNAGERRRSREWFSRALEWATEIDDRTMIATVLSFRGYAAWRDGEAGPAAGLAQAAQRDKRVALPQRAYAAGLEARACAMMGDGTAAERKIGQAMDLAGQLADRPEENRPWSYWYTPGFFTAQHGLVLAALADQPRYQALAADALQAGYDGLAGSEQGSDWGGGFLVHLAAVHARSSDVDRACAVALKAAGIARETGSATLAGMLRRLQARLAARWPDEPRVAELADALR
jgi:transcriptional regulator with XRE-family HTH domain